MYLVEVFLNFSFFFLELRKKHVELVCQDTHNYSTYFLQMELKCVTNKML